MEFICNNLLTLILFTPVLAAVIMLFLPREQEDLIRWAAFVLSLIPLALVPGAVVQLRSRPAGLPVRAESRSGTPPSTPLTTSAWMASR